MAKTLEAVRIEVLTRLGDTENKVWNRDEVDAYLQEAYNRIAYLTGCFWDTQHLDDVAGTATHTLPTRMYQLMRAVWNHIRLTAFKSQHLERRHSRYQTERGPVRGYLLDKDGLRTFRKYLVPSASRGLTITGTGDWGLPRNLADATGGAYGSGTWGIGRYQNPHGAPPSPNPGWGVIRSVHSDTSNTRIEFTRRGSEVTENAHVFELPDVYVKYCRHYAEYRCLHRNSPGQDIELAEHFRQRYEEGVARIQRRMRSLVRNRRGRWRGQSRRAARIPVPSLPWPFPSRRGFD